MHISAEYEPLKTTQFYKIVVATTRNNTVILKLGIEVCYTESLHFFLADYHHVVERFKEKSFLHHFLFYGSMV